MHLELQLLRTLTTVVSRNTKWLGMLCQERCFLTARTAVSFWRSAGHPAPVCMSPFLVLHGACDVRWSKLAGCLLNWDATRSRKNKQCQMCKFDWLGEVWHDRYLIASHTTDYRNPVLILNTIAVFWLVIAKFPNMHKVRLFGINSDYDTWCFISSLETLLPDASSHLACVSLFFFFPFPYIC